MPCNSPNHKDNASVASDEGSTSFDFCPENDLKINTKVRVVKHPRNIMGSTNAKKKTDKLDQPTDKTGGKNSSRRVPSKQRNLVKKQYSNRSQSKKIKHPVQIKKKSSTSAICPVNNYTTPTKSNKKCKKITKRNCNSLTNLKLSEDYNSLSLSSIPKERCMSRFSPGKLFEYGIETNYSKKPAAYLENFDLLCDNHLFSKWKNNPCRDKKGIVFLAPETSSATSLLLKKKTYSFEIIPLKKSEQNTAEESAKSNENDDLKVKAEKTDFDEFLSRQTSDSSASSDNESFEERKHFCSSASENEKRAESSQKNIEDYSCNTASLDIHEPIYLKYIDESTEQTKYLLLYYDEFFKDLQKGKGDASSKKDTLEKVRKCSRRYNGKPLRVLLNAEAFFKKLNSNRKSPQNTMLSNLKVDKKTPISCNTKDFRKSTSLSNSKLLGKVPLLTDSKSYRNTFSSNNSIRTPTLQEFNSLRGTFSPRDAGNAFRHVKKSSTVPSCIGKDENLPKSRPLIKRRNPFAQKCDPQKKIECSDTQISVNERCGSSRTATSDHFIRRSSNIRTKLTVLKNNTGNEYKSRSALKRVNVEEVVASDFKHYFHFFAKLGGRLKSGTVISKHNSHAWMKKTGMIYDRLTQKIADDYFTAIAG